MAKITINVGSAANDGNGDTLRGAFINVNSNFTEVYSDVSNNANDISDLTASLAGIDLSQFISTNNAYFTANAAFIKANSANLMAFSANGWSNAVGSSANSYASRVAANNSVGANAWANTVGTAGNNYTNTVGTAGNNYTITMDTAGNNYTVSVGAASNNYSNSTFVKLSACGTVQTISSDIAITGNLTLIGNSTIISSNNLSVGAASNTWANTVGTAGNNYVSILVANNAVGANTWANTKLANTSTTIAGNLTSTGAFIDSKGDVRDLPINNQSSSYTLSIQDTGKIISLTTGNVFVMPAVFYSGNAVSVYNNSSANVTITQNTSVTLNWAGTANTGNRILQQKGFATIVCVAANTFVVSGAGML